MRAFWWAKTEMMRGNMIFSVGDDARVLVGEAGKDERANTILSVGDGARVSAGDDGDDGALRRLAADGARGRLP